MNNTGGFFVLAVLGVLSVTLLDFSQSYDLILGRRDFGKDTLLVNRTVVKPSTSYFNKNETFYVPRGYEINYIEAKDKLRSYVVASRIRGGLGYSNVTLLFKSKPRESVRYQVQIYGKKSLSKSPYGFRVNNYGWKYWKRGEALDKILKHLCKHCIKFY